MHTSPKSEWPNASTRSLLRALQTDGNEPVLVDPGDVELRAAAIELASNGQARLETFGRRLWELHSLA